MKEFSAFEPFRIEGINERSELEVLRLGRPALFSPSLSAEPAIQDTIREPRFGRWLFMTPPDDSLDKGQSKCGLQRPEHDVKNKRE